MKQSELKEYFSKMGAKGGAISRRTLTPEQARAMAKKSAATRRRKARKRERKPKK